VDWPDSPAGSDPYVLTRADAVPVSPGQTWWQNMANRTP
jgi:hypothetical protein